MTAQENHRRRKRRKRFPSSGKRIIVGGKKKLIKIFQRFHHFFLVKTNQRLTKILTHCMQNAAESPFSFLLPSAESQQTVWGWKKGCLLVLQCCHDCKRRKAAGNHGGNSLFSPRARCSLKSLLLSRTVSASQHHWPWRQLGSRGRDAGMLQLRPTDTLPRPQLVRQGRSYYSIKLTSALDISKWKISHNCYRALFFFFFVNGSSTEVFRI